MRLNALVVDLAVARPRAAGSTSSASARRLPGLAVIVCTGPSSVAQRVRGLRLGADAWITKPCHAEELICVIEAAIRRHRRNEMPAIEDAADVGEITSGPTSTRRTRATQPRADRARVRDPPAALPIRSGAAARGDLRAGVGLRDGARRPLGRRVRPQAAPEAARGLAEWSYIHTHFGVGYRFAPERDGGRAIEWPRSGRTGRRGARAIDPLTDHAGSADAQRLRSPADVAAARRRSARRRSQVVHIFVTSR